MQSGLTPLAIDLPVPGCQHTDRHQAGHVPHFPGRILQCFGNSELHHIVTLKRPSNGVDILTYEHWIRQNGNPFRHPPVARRLRLDAIRITRRTAALFPAPDHGGNRSRRLPPGTGGRLTTDDIRASQPDTGA
jgi:hypothetical protein